MIGAILGDIAGSGYEFAACLADLANGERQSGSYDLFNNDQHGDRQKYTDDTVMTIATLECILDNIEDWKKKKDEDKMVAQFAKYYRKWGNRYPFAGYGGIFSSWLHSDEMGAYNSFGNGSAMRVSPCVLYDTKLAALSAMPTHDHKEGIKGAVVTAECIRMAKEGKSKEEIYQYALSEYPSIHYSEEKSPEEINKAKKSLLKTLKTIFKTDHFKDTEKEVKTELDEFGIEKSITDGKYTYGIDRPVSEYHDTIRFSATCQETVPVAIRCFYETDSFESCMKKINSMLVDTDTICAIAGPICEAFYGNCMGSHEKDVEILNKFLEKDMLDVLNRAGLL